MIPAGASPLVSVIIPNHNGAGYLRGCLGSLARQYYRQMEIVLVDNASTDDSLRVVEDLAPEARILRQVRNMGFAAAVNAGARVARGEWIAVLNNDTEVDGGWIEACLRAADRFPQAAFLACKILDHRNRAQIFSAGDCFLRSGIGYRRGQEQSDHPLYGSECAIFAACGCAALYRRSVFLDLQGYDENFFAYLEDVELGLRLQSRGYEGRYVPDAVVYHVGGGTSGGEFSPLAVRLRTRNALLLLVRSMPSSILIRCLPMILASQTVWLCRATAHGRIWSYLRGLAGTLRLLPAMLRKRRELRLLSKESIRRLRRAIIESETMARSDFTHRPGRHVSSFLEWYFRFFKPSASPAPRR